MQQKDDEENKKPTIEMMTDKALEYGGYLLKHLSAVVTSQTKNPISLPLD